MVLYLIHEMLLKVTVFAVFIFFIEAEIILFCIYVEFFDKILFFIKDFRYKMSL